MQASDSTEGPSDLSATSRSWKGAVLPCVVIVGVGVWLLVVDRLDLLAVKSGTPMTLPPSEATPSAAPTRDETPGANVGIAGLSASGLLRPNEAGLADDEPVIGVATGGESRAYVVRSFEINGIQRVEDIGTHLVNDVVAGRPICVTHCDRSRSTRVLTTSDTTTRTDRPLDVRIGGWQNSMVLVVEGRRYEHHSPDIPLADVRFETTTWGEWRAAHPETLVYLRESAAPR